MKESKQNDAIKTQEIFKILKASFVGSKNLRSTFSTD